MSCPCCLLDRKPTQLLCSFMQILRYLFSLRTKTKIHLLGKKKKKKVLVFSSAVAMGRALDLLHPVPRGLISPLKLAC
jgi:hypothetical protein